MPPLTRRRSAVLVVVLVILLGASGGAWRYLSRDDRPAATTEVKAGTDAEVVTPDGRLAVQVPGSAISGTGTLTVSDARSKTGNKGWSVEMTGGAELTGEATLSFAAPRLKKGEPEALVRSADSPDARMSAADGVRRVDGRLLVRTAHFSFWDVTTWTDILGDVWKSLQDRLDAAASSESEPPTCPDQKGVRSAGYRPDSDTGRRVYWCLGRTDDRAVLKVVNARGYAVRADYLPGLRIIRRDNLAVFDRLADLVPRTTPDSGEAILVPGNSSLDFAVDGTEPTEVKLSPDPGAYLTTALSFAVDTVLQTSKASGATNPITADRVLASLQGSSCMDSLLSMIGSDVTTRAGAQSAFKEMISLSLGCVTSVLSKDVSVGDGPLGWIEWMHKGLVTLLDAASGLADSVFNGTGYRISVVPPAQPTTRVVIDPFTRTFLRPDWTLERSDGETEVDCSDRVSSPYAVGPGTYSCGGAAVSANACWTSVLSTAELWCLDEMSPTSRTLRAVPTSDAEDDTPTPDRPRPIFLELSDGSQWFARAGGAWSTRNDGFMPMYGCANRLGVCGTSPGANADGHYILAKDQGAAVDTSGTAWRVQVGVAGTGLDSLPAPRSATVKRAWFIAGKQWPGH